MTNRQACKLLPGMTIRRTVPYADRATATGDETFVVERIERPARRNDEVTVHADGRAFKAWEIERVGRLPSWPPR